MAKVGSWCQREQWCDIMTVTWENVEVIGVLWAQLVTIANELHALDSLLWDSTVGYRSDSLASS